MPRKSKFSDKTWKTVKAMLDSGMKATEIAKRIKGMKPQDIYNKKKQWKKAEYYSDPKNMKYHTKRYKAWRLAVFMYDGFKCRWCGSTRGLEADHIKPQSTHPELKYKVSNGRTLCRKCHRRTCTYGFKALRYKD